MLVELAMGDAYGPGFEYAPGAVVRAHNDRAGCVQHLRHGIRPGYYTHDTRTSRAPAAVILEERPWTPEVLTEDFVHAFRRDPREGHAGRLNACLQKFMTARFSCPDPSLQRQERGGHACRARGHFPFDQCSHEAQPGAGGADPQHGRGS